MTYTPVVFDLNHNDDFSSAWDIKKSGICAVIHKTSEGTYMRDEMYRTRMNRVKETGMLRGGYHWATNDSIVKQVDSWFSMLEEGELIALDVEESFHRPDKQVTVKQAEQLVKEVFRRTGVLPLVYCGGWLLDQEAAGNIAADSILRDCPMWISRYGVHAPVSIRLSSKSPGIVMHQYTGDGQGPLPHTINGAKGNCDLSIWVGDIADMPRFWAKHAYPGVAA